MNEEERYEISFNLGVDWVMKIIEGPKIIFNTEKYPNLGANDFAKAVIAILENDPGIRKTLKNFLKD